MWLFRGAQSAVYYYLSCIPCANAIDFHKRKREARHTRKEQEKNKDALVADQPRPFLQPTPFSTNPGWAEEISLGPGPPARKFRVDKFVRTAEDLEPPIVGTPRNRADVQWMIQPPPSAKVMAGKEEYSEPPIPEPSRRDAQSHRDQSRFEYRPPPGARTPSPKKKYTPEAEGRPPRRRPQSEFAGEYGEGISGALTESEDEQPARPQSRKAGVSQMPNHNLRSKKISKNAVVPSDIYLFYSSSDCDHPLAKPNHDASSSDHELASVQRALSSAGHDFRPTSAGHNLSFYGRDLDVPYSEIDMAISDCDEFSRPQTPDVRISDTPDLYLRSRKFPKHFSVPDDIHLYYNYSDLDLPSCFDLGLPRARNGFLPYRHAHNVSHGSLESIAVI